MFNMHSSISTLLKAVMKKIDARSRDTITLFGRVKAKYLAVLVVELFLQVGSVCH